ncbi:MAG: manganese efflux pump [Oscillospiraceae bacterium]|nr:manganese efflux pump [Oscillospiraceae bacterium]
MAEGFSFFLNSILFGVGLAMDAFSVSVANALADPGMRHARRIRIAGCFALFQIAMPLVGWLCVRALAERFHAFERLTPWIALILLLYIGGKMIVEALRGGEKETAELGHGTLLLQGVATSIDALSVGFTIERYPFSAALVEALIIGAVTFLICLFGLFLGRRAGERLAGIAPLVGGVILVGIGIEIFLTGVF